MQRVPIVPAQRVRKISRKRSRSFNKVTSDDKSVVVSERKEVPGSSKEKRMVRMTTPQMPTLMDTEKVMYEYVRFECELLGAKSELLILNALQNLTKLFRDAPAFSMMINKQRLIAIAQSKRVANPEKWTVDIAKTFGKLMTVIRQGVLITSPTTSSSLLSSNHTGPIKKRKYRGGETMAPKPADVKSAAIQLLKLSPKCGPMASPLSNISVASS